MPSSSSFRDLGLRAELLAAVRAQGYEEPTPVQLQAIPTVLEGRDLMAAAQTGTGKTAGFTLPMLQRLMEGAPEPAQNNGNQMRRRGQGKPRGRGAERAPRRPDRPIRALVVTPTRELAAQVENSVRQYGKGLPIRSTVIYGGVSPRPQLQALREGIDIVIATPGRLLDHAGSGAIDLSKVEILVLDEADRMLDMGFLPDIRRIVRLLPKQRQSLMFSATFVPEIRSLAQEFLHQPETVDVSPRNSAAETVEQSLYEVDRSRKAELLASLIHDENWSQALVFTRTKHGADRLAHKLERAGVQSTAIHGNKSQNARTKALASFKANRVRVLVATDIAARGLDIEGLPHVVNFDLPNVPEDYVHRIGRTGRAGLEGEAISLVCREERKHLRGIERLLNRRIERRVKSDVQPAGPPAAASSQARSESRPESRRESPTSERPAHTARGEGDRPKRSNRPNHSRSHVASDQDKASGHAPRKRRSSGSSGRSRRRRAEQGNAPAWVKRARSGPRADRRR